MHTYKELHKLIKHEIAYFEFGSNVLTKDEYIALYCDEIPEYRDCNRLLRLRDTGKGPEKTVDQFLKWFHNSGRRVVVDVDYVAEEQRLGSELRSRGVLPVTDNYICLRMDALSTSVKSRSEIKVVKVDKNSHVLEEWIWLNGADESNEKEAEFWRRVARLEAMHPPCKLLLALYDNLPAGACSLFSFESWGRIDSVIVHPEFRRKGIGTALILEAINLSKLDGNSCTYLFTQMYSSGHSLYSSIGFTEWFVNPLRRHFGPVRD